MSGHSRRSFLVTAGAGAAVGAGALMATAEPAMAGSRPEDDLDSSDTIVAYVKNPATGQITLMSGGREIEVTDKAVARALARKVV